MADWAKPFVGYAYANGLTAGTSATTFGGNDLISAAQYITFARRKWYLSEIKETAVEHPTKMAYTYTGRFDGDEPTGWPNGPKTYIIEGYSEKVNIVHETPEEGYVYEFIKVSQSTLDKIHEMRNRK